MAALARTGLCRMVSRNRSIRLQLSRAPGRSQTVRRQSSRAVVRIDRTPTVHRLRSRTIGRSPIGISLLSGPKLLRGASLRSPNTLLLLLRRRGVRRRNNSTSSQRRGSRKRRSTRTNSRRRTRSRRRSKRPDFRSGFNTLDVPPPFGLHLQQHEGGRDSGRLASRSLHTLPLSLRYPHHLRRAGNS
jgi:hypothetical protein